MANILHGLAVFLSYLLTFVIGAGVGFACVALMKF